MRLAILETGHSLLQKVQIKVFATLAGFVPGPLLALSYRRSLFGKCFIKATQEAMRGCREWTAGEAELFAAFVSKQNACRF